MNLWIACFSAALLIGCATPGTLKKAAENQLVLLTEAQKAVSAMNLKLAEWQRANRLSASVEESLGKMGEVKAEDGDLAKMKKASRLSALGDLMAAGFVADSADPKTITDVGVNTPTGLEVLMLQLAVIRSAQQQITRYLVIDVFGNEQVKESTQLATGINGLLKGSGR